jgi:hypothetical protein
MAAGQDYWWVTLGATCGHAICTGVAVIGGRAIAGRVSLKVGKFISRNYPRNRETNILQSLSVVPLLSSSSALSTSWSLFTARGAIHKCQNFFSL